MPQRTTLILSQFDRPPMRCSWALVKSLMHTTRSAWAIFWASWARSWMTNSVQPWIVTLQVQSPPSRARPISAVYQAMVAGACPKWAWTDVIPSWVQRCHRINASPNCMVRLSA